MLFCLIFQEIKGTISLIQTVRSNNFFAGMIKMMTKIDLKTKCQHQQLKIYLIFWPRRRCVVVMDT